jgi:hypothetical protein
MKPLCAAVFAALALPGAAQAGASIVARDVPLHGGTRSPAVSSGRFDLVGLHWRGGGNVRFRTRSVAGRWSVWRTVSEQPDGPDVGSAEQRRQGGWHIGEAVWVGSSNALQTRPSRGVARVRAFFVDSTVSRLPLRRLSVAGSPPIISRLGWGANEQIRRAPPEYAPSIRLAIVHHTVSVNNYSRSQSAAIVRGIELYHVQGNGWNDIGYNFLVDRYGQIFEGRYGGIDRNVVGAHAQGFNTGSTGIALIGNYQSATPTSAQLAALEKLIAWRLDIAHVDPLSTLTFISGGNPRFPAGVPVFLRAVAGHRDVYPTECPGAKAYALLPSIAKAAAAIGLPKLYAPAQTGAVGGPIRFRARLSTSLAWSVTVTDTVGKVLATGTGTGTNVDWTWDATAVPPGRYVWTISAPGAFSATGVIGGSTAPLTLSAHAALTVISPDGDGRADALTVKYRVGAGALVTATVVDPATAKPVARLFSDWRDAGNYALVWKGSSLPDGVYSLQLLAKSPNGTQVQSTLPVVIDRTLGGLDLQPPAFSPNGDGRSDLLGITFRLTGPATVNVRVLKGTSGRAVTATLVNGPLPPGQQVIPWPGPAADGAYRVIVSATDALTTVQEGGRITVDTVAPKLALVSLAKLNFRVSERSVVTLTVNGKRIVKIEKRGAFHVPFRGAPRTLRAVAEDAAGNRSLPLTSP